MYRLDHANRKTMNIIVIVIQAICLFLSFYSYQAFEQVRERAGYTAMFTTWYLWIPLCVIVGAYLYMIFKKKYTDTTTEIASLAVQALALVNIIANTIIHKNAHYDCKLALVGYGLLIMYAIFFNIKAFAYDNKDGDIRDKNLITSKNEFKDFFTPVTKSIRSKFKKKDVLYK